MQTSKSYGLKPIMPTRAPRNFRTARHTRAKEASLFGQPRVLGIENPGERERDVSLLQPVRDGQHARPPMRPGGTRRPAPALS